jgi:hypothetical protein
MLSFDVLLKDFKIITNNNIFGTRIGRSSGSLEESLTSTQGDSFHSCRFCINIV